MRLSDATRAHQERANFARAQPPTTINVMTVAITRGATSSLLPSDRFWQAKQNQESDPHASSPLALQPGKTPEIISAEQKKDMEHDATKQFGQ